MPIQIRPGYSVFVENCSECKVYHGGIRIENEEHTMATSIVDAKTAEEAFKELGELNWEVEYVEFEKLLAQARAEHMEKYPHDKPN